MQNWINAYSAMNLRFLFKGLLVTLEISIVSVILSMIFGSILGIVRYTKIPWLSEIVGFIIDIIRNLIIDYFLRILWLAKSGIQTRYDRRGHLCDDGL